MDRTKPISKNMDEATAMSGSEKFFQKVGSIWPQSILIKNDRVRLPMGREIAGHAVSQGNLLLLKKLNHQAREVRKGRGLEKERRSFNHKLHGLTRMDEDLVKEV